MGKKLLIVESPAKAKTISRYLGDDYQVTASVGHIRDLPSSSLGVDVKNSFKPLYINMRGKEKVIRELKTLAKEADSVLIATDPDREGEAIAWHIAKLLKMDEESQARVTFNEITSKAVRSAVEEPRSINMNLVNAQQARRILDRLVGYELSPLLWKKVKTGLSAGRVQSVATRLLVEREEEIRAFEPEEYWQIKAQLSQEKGKPFTLFYQGREKGKRIEKRRLSNEQEASEVVQNAKQSPFVVRQIKKGQRKRQPYAPFTTSTLQQEASRRLGFTSKRTMTVAQQLYEGIDLHGLGQIALVTYIRTDSVRISAEAQQKARELIAECYGAKFLPEKNRFYRNKNASQDAHEAIRPAHFEHSPERLQHVLTNDQYRLYKLIWERFLASQMADAELSTLSVDVEAGIEIFRCTGEQLLFSGFLSAYGDLRVDKQEEEEDSEEGQSKQSIPELAEGEILNLEGIEALQKFTQPPARYTEASLIKAMEEKGIGRPSTYAPTLSTILQRDYARKDKRQLYPSDLGFVVTKLLRDNFNDLINVNFTAKMEEELDTVEEGKENWVAVMERFYPTFHDLVEKAQEEAQRVEMPKVYTGEKCPDCQEGDLLIKEGRYGNFIACSRFPDCRYTKPLQEKAGANCPLCQADLLVRKSKRGKIFYVCSKEGSDQACAFISWDLPLNGQSCEHCGAYLVQKKFRGRTYPRCSNTDCISNQKKAKSKETEEAKE